MKIVKTFNIMMILSLLVAGCGAKDSPELAAQEWTTALLTFDGNKLAERTCTKMQADVQSTALFVSVFAAIGQQATDQKLQVDLKDLKFTNVSQSKSNARVLAKGEIRSSVLAIFQVTPIDTQFNMVKENGKWKWCGEEPQQATAGLQSEGAAPGETPQSNAQPMLIRAVNMVKKNWDPGWLRYEVHLAMENPVGNPSDVSQIPGVNFTYLRSNSGSYTISLDQGKVQTQEGYTYDVSADAIYVPDFFPDGFRMSGGTLTFQAAESVHVTRIDFPTLSIDLQQVQALQFPTDRPNTEFSKLGDVINIPNRMNIRFNNFSVDQNGKPTVSYTVESLNIGQEENLDALCYIIDRHGTFIGNEMLNLRVGPGQKEDYALQFQFSEPLEAVDGSSAPFGDAAAKLICYGKEINKVINLTTSTNEQPISGPEEQPEAPTPEPVSPPAQPPGVDPVSSQPTIVFLGQQNGVDNAVSGCPLGAESGEYGTVDMQLRLENVPDMHNIQQIDVYYGDSGDHWRTPCDYSVWGLIYSLDTPTGYLDVFIEPTITDVNPELYRVMITYLSGDTLEFGSSRGSVAPPIVNPVSSQPTIVFLGQQGSVDFISSGCPSGGVSGDPGTVDMQLRLDNIPNIQEIVGIDVYYEGDHWQTPCEYPVWNLGTIMDTSHGSVGVLIEPTTTNVNPELYRVKITYSSGDTLEFGSSGGYVAPQEVPDGQYNYPFESDSADWIPISGSWAVDNGSYYQYDEGAENAKSVLDVPDTSCYTYSLLAAKESGREGFLIIFKYLGKYMWWNIGGWANTFSMVEGIDELYATYDNETITGDTVQPGKWYEIKIVVNGDQAAGWIDGALKWNIVRDVNVIPGLTTEGNRVNGLTGLVGVGTWTTAARFDDITVTAECSLP